MSVNYVSYRIVVTFDYQDNLSLERLIKDNREIADKVFEPAGFGVCCESAHNAFSLEFTYRNQYKKIEDIETLEQIQEKLSKTIEKFDQMVEILKG
jgi:hypothetical protein